MLEEDSRRQLHRPAYEVGRVFLFGSIAATITSGNIAVTATKGSSATAAAPYGRAPTFSLRILPRTPGTPANALAGGHDADGHRPVRDLHNGVLDTQHHGVVTNRYATRMFDAGASRTSASSFFGLPITRSSDLRDQQQPCRRQSKKCANNATEAW